MLQQHTQMMAIYPRSATDGRLLRQCSRGGFDAEIDALFRRAE